MFISLIFLLNSFIKGAESLFNYDHSNNSDYDNSNINSDNHSNNSDYDRWLYGNEKKTDEINEEVKIKSNDFLYLQNINGRIVMHKNQKLFLTKNTKFIVCIEINKVNDTYLKSIEDVLAEDEKICDAAYIKYMTLKIMKHIHYW